MLVITVGARPKISASAFVALKRELQITRLTTDGEVPLTYDPFEKHRVQFRDAG
jgi:hypothetical protein